MSPSSVLPRPPGFRHDALLYSGEDAFHDEISAFITDAVAADEPVLVASSGDKIERLAPLASDDLVAFVDMDEVGRNHARIADVWQGFVDAHPGRVMRGVGEPITPARARGDGLADYQHGEALVNAAFAGTAGLWLRCPYDVSVLPGTVIDEARRSHPWVVEAGATAKSASYDVALGAAAVLDAPLPPPAAPPAHHALRPGRLAALRAFVRSEVAATLTPDRTDDLVLAVNEVGCNSLMYAGGGADVLLWRTPDAVHCEIRDAGILTDAMVGRVRPDAGEHAERGMWIVNQVCDFVQLRSSPVGSTIRLRILR